MADLAGPMELAYATKRPLPARWSWPTALFVLAVVLRLAYSLTRPSDVGALMKLPDQVEYWQIGESILNRHGVRMDDVAMREYLYAFRMPGYPLLVAACGGNLLCIRGVQALLDGLTVLAAYRIALQLRGGVAAVVSGTIVAHSSVPDFFLIAGAERNAVHYRARGGN